jgi:O-antigen ligase
MWVNTESNAALYPVHTRENPSFAEGKRQSIRFGRWIDHIVSLLLLLSVLAIPHSVKGMQHTYKVALLLWVTALALGLRKALPQPLASPLFLYLVLSAVSTILSPTPVLSWDRMKIVVLLLVAIVFAQNLGSLKQIKFLVSVLLFSSVLSAGYTAWQYAAGIGVKVTGLPAGSELANAGIATGDIIRSIDGHQVRTPEQFRSSAKSEGRADLVTLQVLRGQQQGKPLCREMVRIHGQQLAAGTPGMQLAVGRPDRAQGFLGHYVTYAEVLLQIALLAWGLLIAGVQRKQRAKWIFVFVFLAIVGTIAATQTRSALGAVMLAAFVVLLIGSRGSIRKAALAGFGIALIASTLWIWKTRGYFWVDMRDLGTQYRVMVWEDGMRLVRQHPLFGVGMESVRVFSDQWGMRAYKDFHVQGHFHSTPIQLAAERGLPALGAWIWLMIAYLSFLKRLLDRVRSADWFLLGIVLGITGSVIGFLVESVVQYNMGEEQVVSVLWLFMGLAVALNRILRQEDAVATSATAAQS